MSEPLSAERLAEIRATITSYARRRLCPELGGAARDLLDEVDRLRARNVIGSRAWLAVEVSRLKDEVDRLRAENARLIAPGCGGPDCRMTELHTVNTCPTHQERVPVYEKTWPASGPSRWFSAADEDREQREAEALVRAMDRVVGESWDDRHGTDPAWDGIES